MDEDETKARKVVMHHVSGMFDNVIFESKRPNREFGITPEFFYMTLREWVDLGQPSVVTITVESGDTSGG